MPLTNDATYEEVLTKLQSMTGINQQSELAATLGSPSLPTDSIGKLVTDLQARKSTLASNLTAKGISSSASESLSALTNKVGNIDVGKKKKVFHLYHSLADGGRQEMALDFTLGSATCFSTGEGWSSLIYDEADNEIITPGGGSYNGSLSLLPSGNLQVYLSQQGSPYVVTAYER